MWSSLHLQIITAAFKTRHNTHNKWGEASQATLKSWQSPPRVRDFSLSLLWLQLVLTLFGSGSPFCNPIISILRTKVLVRPAEISHKLRYITNYFDRAM
jgi:hypothetical protein